MFGSVSTKCVWRFPLQNGHAQFCWKEIGTWELLIHLVPGWMLLGLVFNWFSSSKRWLYTPCFFHILWDRYIFQDHELPSNGIDQNGAHPASQRHRLSMIVITWRSGKSSYLVIFSHRKLHWSRIFSWNLTTLIFFGWIFPWRNPHESLHFP